MTAKDNRSPFEGIDRALAEPRAGTFANANSGPLTLEAIEAGFEAMKAWRPPVPCGSDADHPHITAPAEIRKPVQCVNCGTWVAYTSENRGVDIGGPGLFTDMLYRGKIPIIASPDVPPDTGYFIPSTMTDADQSEVARRVAAGDDPLLATADVMARRSLMVRFDL